MINELVQLNYIEIYLLSVVSVGFLYLLICGSAFFHLKSLILKKDSRVMITKPLSPTAVQKDLKNSMRSIFLFGFSPVLLTILHKNEIIRIKSPNGFLDLFFDLLFLLIWNEIHFYFFHRLFHTKYLYKYHRIHHLEGHVSPLSTFSFHWTETVALGSVIPLAYMIKSVSFESVSFFVISSMTLNTIGHYGVDFFKKWPSFFHFSTRHFDHHKFHKINFGFVIPFPDRLKILSKLKFSSALTLGVMILIILLGYSKVFAASTKILALHDEMPKVSTFTVIENSTLILSNEMVPEPLLVDESNLGSQKIQAYLKCNQAVTIENTFQKFTQKEKTFNLYFKDYNAETVKIYFPEIRSIQCLLKVRDKIIQIKNESLVYPHVNELRLSQISPQVIENDDMIFLKDPYEALNKRFKLLMGYDLSYSDYIKKDPQMQLDFSRMPKLDLVIFDTLQMMNDFAGRIILRALSAHSNQGALVYILSSKALLLPQEIELFKKYKIENPQIYFELYKAESQITKPMSLFHALHRNSHIKVLLTYSKNESKNNAFIAGGRNLSEMYFYPTKPDNSSYPEIIQWGESWYQWGYFDDLDVLIRNDKMTALLARDLLAFNEKNYDKIVNYANKNYFISYPFAKGKDALEKFYVSQIDEAQTEIFTMSPYLNFTPDIKNALIRARERGVSIRFVSNINVETDFMPFVLQPAMHKELRKVIPEYTVYLYQKPLSVLHVKAMLIDNKRLLLGSVNLNRRSFIHDTEIVITVENEKSINHFKSTIEKEVAPYLKKADLNSLPAKSVLEFVLIPFMNLF